MNRKTFLIFLGIFSIILLILVRLLPRVEEIRPYRKTVQKNIFEVTSLSDHGRNSLRETIVEINSSQRPVAIQFKVSGAIILEGPLPPLLNNETTVKTEGAVSIDGSNLSEDAFVWTIKGEGQTISGLSFQGKKNKGLLVLSNKGIIQGCRFEGFDTAVAIGGNNIHVEDSVFRANKRGIEALDGAQFAHIISNKLREGGDAGIWAVWPDKGRMPAFLKVEKNHISNTPAGAILSLDRVDIEGNTLVSNGKGIYIIGSTNIKVRENEIYQNREHGIVMEDSAKNQVIKNAVYQNAVSGILLKRSAGNLISENRIFSNGSYGVIEVLTNKRTTLMPNTISYNLISDNGDGIYILASSPILKGNTIKDNRASVIKTEDYAEGGEIYKSMPRIEEGR